MLPRGVTNIKSKSDESKTYFLFWYIDLVKTESKTNW